MAFLTSGGSLVTSSNIVDGEIINDDIAAAAAIAQAKIAGILDDGNDIVDVEVTVGSTHSLTTVAGQRVVVFAKGSVNINGGPSSTTINLNYNSVLKDTVSAGENSTSSTSHHPFSLMYTEIPGAATQNITVTGSSYTPSNVVILVLKLR